MPDVRKCMKCGNWRHLKCEWPEMRMLDASAVCLICDPTGKHILKVEGYVLVPGSPSA